MWELSTHTTPVARKEYDCGAWQWIDNAGLGERDFEPDELQTIKKAERERFKILKGTKYICVRGKWEGEFSTFRARADLDKICLKYDLYEC